VLHVLVQYTYGIYHFLIHYDVMIWEMMQSRSICIAPREGDPLLRDEVYLRFVYDLHDPPTQCFNPRTRAQGLILLLAGRGTALLDGRGMALAAGDCLRYAPGMHLAWRRKRLGVHLLRVTVKGRRAARMLDAVGLAPGIRRRIPDAACRRFAARVAALHRRAHGPYEAVVLAWELLSACAPPPAAADPVELCCEIMRGRYAEGIGVAELARDVGLDRSTLYRRFRRRHGCAPKAWLDAYRLEVAAEELRVRDASVAEIARDCGFADPSWFGRRFREHFGRTPAAWRAAPAGDRP